MSDIQEIDPNRIPQHIAIIMDGNGRWAKQRGLPRALGHKAGEQTVHTVAEEASRLGVKYLTLYTFSLENWSRPMEEIEALMNLLFDSIEEEIFMKNNIIFRVIGENSRFSDPIKERLNRCIANTSSNTGMTMVLALSYSAQWELTEATKQIATLVKNGELSVEDVTADTIQQHLSTSFMPNPDLLIRTGGECRLSNFLLWQCAYSELYFCDTFWPDFGAEHLREAVSYYQQRERRFGKTSEQIS